MLSYGVIFSLFINLASILNGLGSFNGGKKIRPVFMDNIKLDRCKWIGTPKRWPGRQIPYKFSSAFNLREKQFIQRTMEVS